jgi:hypothetical protein
MAVPDIDGAISRCDDNIAHVSYDSSDSLYVQMNLWITGLLGPAGVFPPTSDETQQGQRKVTDWYAQQLLALNSIEGQGVGDSGVVGTSECINAVFRVLNAVKFARINQDITQAQEDDVVDLYNDVWE